MISLPNATCWAYSSAYAYAFAYAHAFAYAFAHAFAFAHAYAFAYAQTLIKLFAQHPPARPCPDCEENFIFAHTGLARLVWLAQPAGWGACLRPGSSANWP